MIVTAHPLKLFENKPEAIAKICERFAVERLEVFSSALRDDFGACFNMRDELQNLLGRKIDLVITSTRLPNNH